MTTFKYKPNKIKYINCINTLDSTHKTFANKFKHNKQILEQKKERYNKIIEELNDIDKANSYTIDDIKNKSKLKKELHMLQDDINDIENDVNEINYYKNTGDLIMEYYDETDDEESSNACLEDAVCNDGNMCEKNEVCARIIQFGAPPNITNIDSASVAKNDESSVLDKLNDISKKNRKQKKETKNRAKTIKSNKCSILDFFKDDIVNECDGSNNTCDQNDKNNCLISNKEADCDKCINDNTNCKAKDNCSQMQKNKATIFEQYLKLLNGNYNMQNKNQCMPMCNNCNIDKVLMQSEGMYVCTKCGEVENVIIESDIPNYKDQIQEKPAYCIWVRRTGGCGFARILFIIMN